LETAQENGGKLIFAPFWVERLYAQLGCFLDRSALITSPGSTTDELKSKCYQIIFPASPEFVTSEYGNINNRIYPESKWVKAAIEWALTTTVQPDSAEHLASDLTAFAGPAPWIAGSIIPKNHKKMLDFIARIIEWVALTIREDELGNRSFVIEDETMRLLFRDNPGIHSSLKVVSNNVKRWTNEPLVKTADLRRDDVGIRALLVWFHEFA